MGLRLVKEVEGVMVQASLQGSSVIPFPLPIPPVLSCKAASGLIVPLPKSSSPDIRLLGRGKRGHFTSARNGPE